MNLMSCGSASTVGDEEAATSAGPHLQQSWRLRECRSQLRCSALMRHVLHSIYTSDTAADRDGVAKEVRRS